MQKIGCKVGGKALNKELTRSRNIEIDRGKIEIDHLIEKEGGD